MKLERGQPKDFTYTQASKRRRLRKPLIVLQASDQPKRMAFFGYAKNLSMGGMFIASINPPPPGRKFNLEFTLPATGHNIKCVGEVVWNRTYSNRGKYEPGMGLRFVDIAKDMASEIDQWANAIQDQTPAPVM